MSMDYYQGVVTDYLSADRSTFVNSECLIQLDAGNTLGKGRHWYCDAIAVNFRESTAYLCEVSYSTTLYGLLNRLKAWSASWPLVCDAISRECSVPRTWSFRPWVFIPEDRDSILNQRLKSLATSEMPTPHVTHLESIVPWKYGTSNSQGDNDEDDV